MKISELFKTVNFDNTMLLGFYGGGNFGDELLLEVLLHKFSLEKYSNTKVFNIGHVDFQKYHSSFENAKIINLKKSKRHFFLESLRSKNIVVGGGGLWGLDFNANVFIFSVYLFVMRYIFFKKVFLVGIGFYGSTTRMGRLMGWVSAMAANIIIARDEETYANFSRIVKNRTFLDKDIVFYIEEFFNDKINIENDVREIRKNFVAEKDNTLNVLMINRRFKPGKADRYLDIIGECAKNMNDVEITLSIMEPKQIDKQGYATIKDIGDKFKCRYFDFNFNPLAFYFFLKRHGHGMVIIAPQYHVQLVAHLAGVSFMPISYDNKCKELFNILGIKKFYNIDDIKTNDVIDFIGAYKRNN